MADGVPLLEPLGVTIEGHKTLIRGLKTRSIGLGGDSRVRVDKGKLCIGPRREGPAAAFGGPWPTPTDAMIILGLTRIGDRAKAETAVAEIAGKMNTSVPEAARAIFEKTCQGVASAVSAMIEEINNKPVYTIHELLEGKKLRPSRLFIVGGPAGAVAPQLGEILGCEVVIPQNAEVANAFGAALARTTAEITMIAETERGSLTIAEEGLQMKIPNHFTRKDLLKIGYCPASFFAAAIIFSFAAIRNSTLRFCVRPSAVVLSYFGTVSPNPLIVSRLADIFLPDR